MFIKLTYKDSAKLEDTTYQAKVVSVNPTHDGSLKRLETLNKQSNTKLNKFLGGVTGLSKSVLGIGLATDEVIEERRSICSSCQYRNKLNCTKCGCYIKHKTKLAGEKCPMGYWGSDKTKKNKRSNGCGCGKNNY